ncbi:hypothetical protein JOF56_010133 [Kibdelosporangium banguiense]|uniref:DUF3267 domain-containing protein n=1 Tax=Kibdelosporangium banguiense TaxID=1365924 RepID=A0ABS4TZC9_9PSEU|nr:hypothetical protein [Kibdelosporangium banguiense]MBP2329748.1 hypothetical protein [Kibdelosporangium banguiense]
MAVAVAAQVWPLLVFLGAFLAIALAWLARSGDSTPAEMAWWLFKAAALGLVGSFALHESAHVMVLKRIRTVTHIAIDRMAWRTSVLPQGTMTGRQIAGVAIAGPFFCVVVGAVLWASRLDRSLAWWYLAHGVFLLPFFGDGRSLRQGLRTPWRQPAKKDRG